MWPLGITTTTKERRILIIILRKSYLLKKERKTCLVKKRDGKNTMTSREKSYLSCSPVNVWASSPRTVIHCSMLEETTSAHSVNVAKLARIPD